MIKYIKKDITSVSKGIVAHGCNCQGVMGAGVALAIRNKWPIAYERYQAMCNAADDKSKLLGTSLIINIKPAELFVANMFTQETFGRAGLRYASMEAIEASLYDTCSFARATELPLYMPRIGCGLGGLDWQDDVAPIVDRMETTFPTVQINVCDL